MQGWAKPKVKVEAKEEVKAIKRRERQNPRSKKERKQKTACANPRKTMLMTRTKSAVQEVRAAAPFVGH
jgi:hypothetical protein